MRRMLTIVLVAGFAMATAASPASSIEGGEIIDFEVTCDGIVVTYAELTFDRDNTGQGAEFYVLSSVDGDGNSLFFYEEVAEVGQFIPSFTEEFPFETPPTANPISLTLVSVAGNGFDEQVVWDVAGDSPCLPPSGGPVDPPIEPIEPPAEPAPAAPTVTTPRFTG